MKVEQNIEKLVDNYQVPSTKQKEEAWNELISRLDVIPEKPVVLLYRNKWFSLAASVLVAVLIFTFIADSFLRTQNYITLAGQQRIIQLPDNSTVTLNPRSELKVNYSFITGRRNIDLNGEALFTVNPGKTFSVKFSGGKVKVLGTIFTVSAYNNTIPKVNCISGSVKVKTEKQETILESGRGIVVKTGSELKPVDLNNAQVLSEINGDFSWNNEPLQNIFSILEIRFGYDIQASEGIKTRNFSGKINMQKLKPACDILSLAMDLECTINKQTKVVLFENSN